MFSNGKRSISWVAVSHGSRLNTSLVIGNASLPIGFHWFSSKTIQNNWFGNQNSVLIDFSWIFLFLEILPRDQYLPTNLLHSLEKVMDRSTDGLDYFMLLNSGLAWWPDVSQRFLRFLQAEAKQNLKNHGIPEFPEICIDRGGTELWSVAKPKENACCFPGVVPLDKESYWLFRWPSLLSCENAQKKMIFAFFHDCMHQNK